MVEISLFSPRPQEEPLRGKLFSRGSIHKSLRAMPDGTVPASMPVLALGFPHQHALFSGSEEHVGPGEFQGKKGTYVATLHPGVDGGGLLSPDIIETAVNKYLVSWEGLLPYTLGLDLRQAYLGADVFANLLQGGMPDGSSIPCVPYDELLASGPPVDIAHRYVSVRPLEQRKPEIVRLMDLYDAVGNVADSQVITHLGGREPAQDFVSRVALLEHKNLVLPNPYKPPHFDPSVPQGYLLSLFSHQPKLSISPVFGGSKVLGVHKDVLRELPERLPRFY